MKKIINYMLIAFIAFVFIQSLFFKFTKSPETDYIFIETLDPWAFDVTGFHLFAYNGIFSAYTIGTAELVASIILIFSLIPKFNQLRIVGAILSMAIMTGAISFHLFTPLGIDVHNTDGSSDMGELFKLAVVVWVSAFVLIILNFNQLIMIKNTICSFKKHEHQ